MVEAEAVTVRTMTAMTGTTTGVAGRLAERTIITTTAIITIAGVIIATDTIEIHAHMTAMMITADMKAGPVGIAITTAGVIDAPAAV